MTKTRIAYLLLLVFLSQPALSNAAEKDSGSFFHRTRKAQIEKKAAEQEATPPAASVDSSKETTSTDENSVDLKMPPAIPVEPSSAYLTKNSPPKAPQDIPSPPPPIPGAPKSAPKPVTIPKTK